MKRKKGPWLVEETVQKYKSEWLDVCEDRVIRPDGKAGSFATVKIRPGVSVLAIDEEHEVYLTCEYRYAIEQESIEVVSGAIDGSELPGAAARRELREELGIEAERWVDVGTVHPLTSVIHSPASLFIARGLSFLEPEPQGTEIIRMMRVKLGQAVRMVMESEIKHAPSCVLILKANQLVNGENQGSSR
ncbi:MAG: NUDIX hydrolase [Blastocatellia bacterium]|nr:NUDIX hydrolase [Blastocatellia bacterium]